MIAIVDGGQALDTVVRAGVVVHPFERPCRGPRGAPCPG